ncbi:hypothetical protein [Shimazuella alba]|uniref:Uncharacterized protein n=1 Tax=Shimazuella alba TaxID=2690964 RepID=A0A6I4VT25_9BACL|nr:hypothetical protein [Shimazuella alba]MXQ53056.1 hypothetical protein [Shimazuella alba]
MVTCLLTGIETETGYLPPYPEEHSVQIIFALCGLIYIGYDKQFDH